MKKFLNIFFVTLGVIFFIIILVGGFMFLSSGGESDEVVIDKNPLLNETQEKTLEKFGIDPADVPSEISTEQEQCFVDAIGAERVAEIKAGDSPTATEFFKSKNCI
jgi:hypothetical protein